MSTIQSLLSKGIGLIQILRPLNGILGGFSAFVGAYLIGGVEVIVLQRNSLFISATTVFLILSGGNAINDFFDLDIDRVNHPRRPLPSGRVKREEALLLAVLFFLMGITLSFYIHLIAFLIAIFATLSLVLYSLLLKKKGIAGNILVSFLSAIVFPYGGLAVSPHSAFRTPHIFQLFFPFLFAFLFHLGREIVKDTADMEGDSKWNARTLPLQHGKTIALNYSFRIFLLLILITPLPFFFRAFNLIYLLMVLFGVDLFLLLLLLYLFQNPTSERLSKAEMLMKADMGVGLLALLLGKI